MTGELARSATKWSGVMESALLSRSGNESPLERRTAPPLFGIAPRPLGLERQRLPDRGGISGGRRLLDADRLRLHAAGRWCGVSGLDARLEPMESWSTGLVS
jgi:hypothetical protein